MEKLQRRAIRIVFNDYSSSYKELLTRAKIPSLYVSRLKAIAIETYKCIHKINPEFLHDIFQVNDTGYMLRDQHRVILPKVSTTSFGINSFSFEASKIWNGLPSCIKDSDKLDVFMLQIKTWPGPECVCGTCVLCQINIM